MITLASLTGFMFGSLNKIWPWKEYLTFYTYSEFISHALTQRNILPGEYESLTGNPSHLFAVIGLILIGFILIFAIEYIAEVIKKRREKIAHE